MNEKQFRDEIIEAAEVYLSDFFREWELKDVDTTSDTVLEWSATIVAIDYVGRECRWPMCLISRREAYPYTGDGFRLSIDLDDAGTLDATEGGFFQYLAGELLSENDRLKKRIAEIEGNLDDCSDDLAQCKRYTETLKAQSENRTEFLDGLLRKYIDYVGDVEGADFISTSDRRYQSSVEFLPSEWNMLKQISEEQDPPT